LKALYFFGIREPLRIRGYPSLQPQIGTGRERRYYRLDISESNVEVVYRILQAGGLVGKRCSEVIVELLQATTPGSDIPLVV
jgi:hypothetical protein